MITPNGLADEIAAFRFEPEQWLWCLHCERFFQGRDARPDNLGGVQACAFAECDGAGCQVDLFEWDVWPEGCPEILPRWPKAHELRKGLRAAAWPTDDDLAAFDPWSSDRPEPGFVRNEDLARRNAILGLLPRTSTTNEASFRGLDLLRLATLLHERFVAPWDRQPLYPAMSDCLVLLAQYPGQPHSSRQCRHGSSSWPRAGWCLPPASRRHAQTSHRSSTR